MGLYFPEMRGRVYSNKSTTSRSKYTKKCPMGHVHDIRNYHLQKENKAFLVGCPAIVDVGGCETLPNRRIDAHKNQIVSQNEKKNYKKNVSNSFIMASLDNTGSKNVVMYPFRTSHVFYFIPNFDHFFLRSPSNDIEGYSVQSRSNKMRAKVYIQYICTIITSMV